MEKMLNAYLMVDVNMQEGFQLPHNSDSDCSTKPILRIVLSLFKKNTFLNCMKFNNWNIISCLQNFVPKSIDLKLMTFLVGKTCCYFTKIKWVNHILRYSPKSMIIVWSIDLSIQEEVLVSWLEAFSITSTEHALCSECLPQCAVLHSFACVWLIPYWLGGEEEEADCHCNMKRYESIVVFV